MKLHLPHALRSAVLACMATFGGFATTIGSGFLVGGALTLALVTQQVSAGWSTDKYTDKSRGVIYYYVTAPAGEEINILSGNIADADYYTKINIVPGEQEMEVVVTSVTVREGDTVLVSRNPWTDPIRDFKNLTIGTLSYGGENSGGYFNVGVNHTVAVQEVVGKIAGGMIEGELILGSFESLTHVSGTLVNTGSLKLNGKINIDLYGDYKLVSEVSPEAITWSDAVNSQGFEIISGAEVLLVEGEVDAEEAEFEGAAVTKNSQGLSFTLAQRKSKVYKVINADVSTSDISAEEWANLTAFELANNRTLTINTTGDNRYSVSGGSVKLVLGKEAKLEELIGIGSTISSDMVTISGTNTVITDISGKLNVSHIVVDGEYSDSADEVTRATLNVEGCAFMQDLETLTIRNGGRLVRLSGGDENSFLHWGSKQEINILSGGEMDLGTSQNTFDSYDTINLSGGRIVGSGHTNGNLDFHHSGTVITSSGASSISAELRLRNSGQNVVMDVTDALTINGNIKGAGDLVKRGSGVLGFFGDKIYTGSTTVQGGTLLLDNCTLSSSLVTLSGGVLRGSASSSIVALAGSGDILVDSEGSLFAASASGVFNKKGAGSLTIGTMRCSALGMNYEGTLTIENLELAANAILTYGNVSGSNLLHIDALSEAVIIDVFNQDVAAGFELDLGIATSVDKSLISVCCLEEYELLEEDGYWKLKVDAGARLDSDWDTNWGSAGLVGAPTQLTAQTFCPTSISSMVLRGEESSLKFENNNVVVVAGYKDASYTGDTWLMVEAGVYKAVVGGNNAANKTVGEEEAHAAPFTGNSHIVLKGGKLGSIIGGQHMDGHGAVFTGDSYISVFGGEVTASIIGGSTNALDKTTTFNGNTHIFVYVPLSVNDNTTPVGQVAPSDAVIGAGTLVDGYTGTNNLNGSTNVTIDLSGYEGELTTFNKIIVGGGFFWYGYLYQNISGDTNVTIKGKNGIDFTKEIIGGHRGISVTQTLSGTSTITISGGSTFSSNVVGGAYLTSDAISKHGNSVLNISGGTYNSNVVGGAYLDGSVTSVQGNSLLNLSGGAFRNVYGAAFINGGAASIRHGNVTINIGGSATVSSDLVGGMLIGYNDDTDKETSLQEACLGSVTINISGGTVTDVYGGSNVWRGSKDSTIVQGDIVIDLTGGAVNGNVYAAGAQNEATKLGTASTLVKIGSGVKLTDGKTISAGYKVAAGKSGSTITGDHAILFTGDTTDRSGVTLEGFNKIGVETAGKTVTVGALKVTEAVNIYGAGTIKLGEASEFAAGVTVDADAALDMNGKNVTGDVTVAGTLTGGSGAIAGTLTIADAATLTDAATATNIVVDTYNNTQGLTATGDISVGTKLSSSAALTASKITGAGNVEITGGTVTLSDTTDAFANSGTTSISGAELAGTWTADGTSIGAGNTVSGNVTLANSSINATITNSGTVTLSGKITVGVSGVSGDATYSHGAQSSEIGNGFYSGITTYALVNGGTSTAENVTWVGMSGAASYSDGTLTVVSDKELAVYHVNTGEVTYDGSAATWNSEAVALTDATTQFRLNGGVLKVTGADTTLATGFVTAGTSGGTLELSGQSITSAVFGTLGGEVSLKGSGVYDLADSSELAGSVSLLADGWTGTVKTTKTLSNTADVSELCVAGSTLDLGGLEFTESLATFVVAGSLILSKLTIADALLPTDLGTVTLVQASSVTGGIGEIGSSGFEQDGDGWVAKNIGGYSYTISVRGGVITLTTDMAGIAWSPAADNTWKQTDSTNWTSDEPGESKEIALFNGNGVEASGIGTVTVSGEVTPDGVVIYSEGDTYSFEGDTEESKIASTGTLNILTGTAQFDNIAASFQDTVVGTEGAEEKIESSRIASGAVLQIGDGDASDGFASVEFETLSIAGKDEDVANGEAGALMVSSDGCLTVATLETAGTVELKDGGILYARSIAISEGGEVKLDGGALYVDSLDVGTFAGIELTSGSVSVEGDFTGDLDEVSMAENSTGRLALSLGTYTDDSFAGTDDYEHGLTVTEGVDFTVSGEFKTGALKVEEGGSATFEKDGIIQSMAEGSKVTLGSKPEPATFALRSISLGDPSFVENFYYSGSTVSGYNAENIMEVSITPEAGAAMGFDATNAIVKLGTEALKETISLADASSMTGGELCFTLDAADIGRVVFSGGNLVLDGTEIILTTIGTNVRADLDTTIAALNATDDSVATVTTESAVLHKYYTNIRLEGGNVVGDFNTTYAESKVEVESANGAAGAALLSDALLSINPQATAPDGDLAAIMNAVDAGAMTDKDLAAVAGASIATMGMALSGDVERQLSAIRNRTTSMGVNECVVNEGMPYFNAWVNAEGNRAELDKDGTDAGYKLDSWGGTVGFDVDLNPNFTMGMAITAMYGDLTADGPEAKAEGDMDTYYVSLFARYASCAWTHTFVATVGMMDGSLDRTVNIGGRTYDTEGSVDGVTFGLLYEVGYVMPLNEEATACLQPVFNVMLRHTSIGSYTEKGSDAALDVDSQSMTTLTFGLGARMQAVVGENLYNRSSIFEARALAKVDLGDRRSKTDVGIVGGSRSSEIRSAELGAFGVELGAGLTIPLGDDDGSIFVDGAVELQSGYTNVNATVGYRINF